MTNQTPSTEDVRHHLVEIEPSDSICRECSTFDGHVYTDTVEWPCPVETRDREVAAKALRDAAATLRLSAMPRERSDYWLGVDVVLCELDARADRIGAGHE